MSERARKKNRETRAPSSLTTTKSRRLAKPDAEKGTTKTSVRRNARAVYGCECYAIRADSSIKSNTNQINKETKLEYWRAMRKEKEIRNEKRPLPVAHLLM